MGRYDYRRVCVCKIIEEYLGKIIEEYLGKTIEEYVYVRL